MLRCRHRDEPPVAPLEPEKASSYRALVARCNYIAVDRADAQYAIKELEFLCVVVLKTTGRTNRIQSEFLLPSAGI